MVKKMNLSSKKANPYENKYKDRLKQERPGVKLIGEYVNSKTKTLHVCHCGNDEWMVTPEKVFKQQGCRRCSQRQSPEVYAQYLRDNRPELTNLEDYVTNSTKILHRCNKADCKNEWYATPNSIKDSGTGCPKCGIVKYSSKRLHSQEDYEKIVCKINPKVKVVGTYVSNHIEIDHQCLVESCRHKWLARPSNIKSGKGCPECEKVAKRQRNKASRIPHEQFLAQVKEINPNIEILGIYTTAKAKVECKCLIAECGRKWDAIATGLKAGKGCPECGVKKAIAAATSNKMSHDEYVAYVESRRQDLTVIGEYENTETKVLHRCTNDECLYEWLILPRDVKRFSAPCPKCSNRSSDTVYTWQDDSGNWKIGVTLERRCQKRVKEVSQAHDTNVKGLRVAIVGAGNAIRIERLLHGLFQEKPYDSGDGYTEFRTLSDEEATWLNIIFDDLIEYGRDQEKFNKIIDNLLP
ncbi:GIY-YIG nuclease family protein [Vibrio hepatarius]|uniref:GIY-YIG nuclease family protein n=1 Tax=Vibrio hepatarius TaxID=171383 RepID=UPI00142DE40D|nr:GIY-YIG nuclease family protein [Vibrio hepatarius]NIY81984.1 GIY-YIG nuclease family protein [Vibrio hepatarius]